MPLTIRLARRAEGSIEAPSRAVTASQTSFSMIVTGRQAYSFFLVAMKLKS